MTRPRRSRRRCPRCVAPGGRGPGRVAPGGGAQAALARAALCHPLLLKVTVPSVPVVRNWSRPASGWRVQTIRRQTVQLADAERTGSRCGCRVGRHHQRALHLIRRPVRMLGEQHRRRARTHGAEKEVPSAPCSRRDECTVAPWPGRYRARPARSVAAAERRCPASRTVGRVAPRRPGRDVVRVNIVVPDNRRTDRDHERVVAGANGSRSPGRWTHSSRQQRQQQRRSARASPPPDPADRDRLPCEAACNDRFATRMTGCPCSSGSDRRPITSETVPALGR